MCYLCYVLGVGKSISSGWSFLLVEEVPTHKHDSFVQARNIIFSRDYNWEIRVQPVYRLDRGTRGIRGWGGHVAPPGEGDSSVQAHNMTQKSIWDFHRSVTI